MSLNTKKFGSTANYKREPWKSPIPVFIEVLYFKHLGKTKTDKIPVIFTNGQGRETEKTGV